MANIRLTDFEENIGKLVRWFKTKLNAEHTRTMYQKLQRWPVEALRFAVDEMIENKKPSPGNFPTVSELRSVMSVWVNNHPRECFARTEFDPVEDFNYPIQKLYQAVDILVQVGPKAFENFCRVNRMPANDKERCINKARSAYPEAEVDKMIAGVAENV